MKKICLIGGFNFVSIVNTKKMEIENSIPSSIYTRFGGVAWNIAQKLSEYKDGEISFVSVLSNDVLGKMAIQELDQFSIRHEKCIFTEEWKSYYCHITLNSENYGFDDMTCIELITPEYIRSIKDYLETFDLIFLDANLSENTISYISNNINVPICFDGTSTEKCIRVRKCFNNFSMMKLNKHEFCKLFDKEEITFEDDETILNCLGNAYKTMTFITFGAQGSMCCYNNKIIRHHTNNIIPVNNALRAGDTYVSGLIKGFLDELCIEKILKIASNRSELVLTGNLEKE